MLKFSKRWKSTKYDVIIVGAGHNGLTAAAYLAKAKLKVLVLESRHVIGGAAVTEELLPNFHFSRCSYLLSLLHSDIVKDLDLKEKGGLKYWLREPFNSFTPLLDGKYLLLGSEMSKNQSEIAKFSSKDAKVYPIYEEWLLDIVNGIKPLISNPPADLARISHGNRDESWIKRLKELATNLKPPLKAASALGASKIPSFYEILTSPATKILNQWFESEPLISTLATDAVIGADISPNTPGSGYVLLHHVMGELDGRVGAWGVVQGGMGGVSNSIAKVAESYGVEIRTNCKVNSIQIDKSLEIPRATGVVLKSGEVLESRVVMSNATPKITFLDLLPSGTLSSTMEKAVKEISFQSATTKINLAVNALPNFNCLPNNLDGTPSPHHRTTIHLGASSIGELHQAYNECSTGKPSSRPLIEMTIPSAFDSTIAPPGMHVINLFVQWTPYQYFKDNIKAKSEYTDHVLSIIDEYAPGFSKSVLFRDILTPPDLEDTFGLTGGNIFHGSMSLDQLYFLRPTAAHAKQVGGAGGYRTPVENYYLCGAGAHPGGGVMGLPGKIAASLVLQSMQKN